MYIRYTQYPGQHYLYDEPTKKNNVSVRIPILFPGRTRILLFGWKKKESARRSKQERNKQANSPAADY